MANQHIVGATAAALLALLTVSPTLADDAKPAADAPAATTSDAPATTGSTAPAADEGATEPDAASDPSDSATPPAGDAAKE